MLPQMMPLPWFFIFLFLFFSFFSFYVFFSSYPVDTQAKVKGVNISCSSICW